jgi:hypothetical protein
LSVLWPLPEACRALRRDDAVGCIAEGPVRDERAAPAGTKAESGHRDQRFDLQEIPISKTHLSVEIRAMPPTRIELVHAA